MKAGSRLFKLTILWIVLAAATDVLAQLPGPFEFSFATSFLNNIFLAPLRFGGCL